MHRGTHWTGVHCRHRRWHVHERHVWSDVVDRGVCAVMDARHVWTDVHGGNVRSDVNWWGVGSDVHWWRMRRNVGGVLMAYTAVEMPETAITTSNTSNMSSEWSTSEISTSVTTASVSSSDITSDEAAATAAFVTVAAATISLLCVLSVRVFDDLQLGRLGLHFDTFGTGGDDQLWRFFVHREPGLGVLIFQRVAAHQGGEEDNAKHTTHGDHNDLYRTMYGGLGSLTTEYTTNRRLLS